MWGQIKQSVLCNRPNILHLLLQQTIPQIFAGIWYWGADPKLVDKGSLNLSKLKKKSWYKHYDSLQQRVNLSVNEKDKDPESTGLK